MRKRNQYGLATWLKWLVGVLVAIIVLGLATCGVTGLVIWNAVNDMKNPEKIKQLAATYVVLPDPLPDPYKYEMGLDMFGMVKFVTIEDQENNLHFSIASMINKEAGLTADTFLDKIVESGIPTASSSGSQSNIQIEVSDRGTMNVGGIDIPFVKGTTIGEQGRSPSILGCALPKSDQAILMLVVAEPGAASAKPDKESEDRDEPQDTADKSGPESSSDEPQDTAGKSGQKSSSDEPQDTADKSGQESSSDEPQDTAGSEKSAKAEDSVPDIDMEKARQLFSLVSAFK